MFTIYYNRRQNILQLCKILVALGSIFFIKLTHQVPVLPSYRNQSIDVPSKLIDWFLYEGNTGT